MKRFYFCLIFTVYFVFLLPAEEISRNVTFDINNKRVTTIEYTNEKDGLIKAEFYGENSLYTDKKYYYDKTNPHYFERREFYDYYYFKSDKDSGISRYAVFYLQKGNPLEEDRVEIAFNGLTIVYIYYYIANNKENLLNEIVETTIEDKIIRKQKIYADESKSVDHIKDFAWFYDNDGNVTKTVSRYFTNPDCVVDQQIDYAPPLFLEKDSNPFKSTTTFKDDPDGYLRISRIYDGKGLEIITSYVDPQKNKTGYTKSIEFYQNDKMLRKIQYYDNILLRDKIYFVSWFFNEDGSIKLTQFFDRNDNEIKP
jgi:hypothetical protein